MKVEEIRVLGIGLQAQPRRINDPASDADEQETALLFDYETDFKIGLEKPALETERYVTARVNGSGFRISGGPLAWVQVPRDCTTSNSRTPDWKLARLAISSSWSNSRSAMIP